MNFAWKDKWCKNQYLDNDGSVLCLAHLAEARVLRCPYKSSTERLKSEYPCSDYREVQMTCVT